VQRDERIRLTLRMSIGILSLRFAFLPVDRA